MDRYQTRIEAAYLVKCSPQAAYDWLHEHRHAGDERPSWDDETPKVLEYLLTRRNDPLIDLGIARFGNSTEAIKRVVKGGDLGLRCAAFANPRVGPSGFFRDGWLDDNGLKELIHNGTYAELEALAANQFLDDKVLEHLLERKEEFADLSDARYLRMVMWLSRNPRMWTPYDDRVLDGHAKYRHENVFSLAWELARTLPAEQAYAAVLNELLEKTSLPVNYEDPKAVIARWRIEEEPEDDERPIAYSYFLRSRLADILEPDDDLLNSDDLAVRESFYRRFSPWDYKDWPKFIERNGEIAFDAMVENNHLWQSEDRREQLRELAWTVPDPHSSMMAPNTYRWAEERKRKEHPEWFRDEDEEYSSEPDAIIRRLEKKIDKIATSMDIDIDGYGGTPAVSRIENKIAIVEETVEKIENVEDKIDRIERTLEGTDDRSTDDLNAITDELRELRAWLHETKSEAQSAPQPTKVVPTWVWLVGIAIALLLVLKP